MISDAAQSLTGLLRDVLDVSRAEAGRERGRGRRLRPAPAADVDRRRAAPQPARPHRWSCSSTSTRRARRAPRRRRARAPDRPQPRLQRRQVHRGGVARIDARVDGDKLQITVSDTGRGIAEEDLARLFEPWTRTHTRAWAGTGLGLSIARRLARAMGGDVTVAQHARRGLGVHARAAAGDRPGDARDGLRRPRPRWPRARVLVAEDDAALRRLIGMQLERLGVRPSWSSTARPPSRRASGQSLRRGPARPAHAGPGRARSGGGDPRARRPRSRSSRSPPTRPPRTSSAAAPRAWTGTSPSRSRCPRCAPSSTAGSRRCSTTACSTSSPTTSAGPRSWTRCWRSTTASLAGRLARLKAATTPEELRDAAHALRSRRRLRASRAWPRRLRRVEAAARDGRDGPAGVRLDSRGAG